MDPIVRTIPEEVDVTSDLNYIYIKPDTKIAGIQALRANGQRDRAEVDLATVVANASVADRAIIRIFLRQIVATGFNMPLADVPDVV